MLRPLLGGLFIGVLSALPVVSVGNCCCLWIVGGGVLAAYLDQQNEPRPITAGRGALTGLLAGVIGAFVWLIVVDGARRRAGAAAGAARRASSLRNARDMPPEVRAMARDRSAPVVVGRLRLRLRRAAVSPARSSRRSAACSAPRSSGTTCRRRSAARRAAAASAAVTSDRGPALSDPAMYPDRRYDRPEAAAEIADLLQEDRTFRAVRRRSARRPTCATRTSTRAPSAIPEAFWAGFAERARVVHAVDAGARLEAAAREVVRRRHAQRQRQLRRPPRARRRAATRPRSSGKASRAIAAR